MVHRGVDSFKLTQKESDYLGISHVTFFPVLDKKLYHARFYLAICFINFHILFLFNISENVCLLYFNVYCIIVHDTTHQKEFRDI